MKLWDKGYNINHLVEDFTVGKDRELDTILAPADILGNIAHLRMLQAVGLISRTDSNVLLSALKQLHEEARQGNFHLDKQSEDIHSEVENRLTQTCGEAGKRIHTGRSRNDQILLDLKIFTRSALWEIEQHVGKLFKLLIEKADLYKDILLPGYTHLQLAMPSSFGLWFGGYAEALADDLALIKEAFHFVNTNPLGTGAGFGSSLPLDRQLTTTLLGFDDLIYNPVCAQLQRGKMERTVLFALAGIASTLGRLAADVCLYVCPNFAFLRLPDEYTTGSSIMPHKKNPDVFELIRARCNRLQFLPAQITSLYQNLTSGYFRDMQLIKETYLPAFQELKDCLSMTFLMLEHVEINPSILESSLYNQLFTVEIVNKQTIEGIPFRDAYKNIARQVQQGEYPAKPEKITHTHLGSMGNLCLERIQEKFQRHSIYLDISQVIQAERKLLENY